MAKIPFSKLGAKCNTDIATITWHEQSIEVRQYLPMIEKAVMISSIINQSADDNGFYNPLQLKVYLVLEMMYNYTNISFTEKQRENATKLYDTVVSSGLYDVVMKAIPEEELQDVHNNVNVTIKNVYDYKNSVLGILEAVKINYSDFQVDTNALQSQLTDPENLSFLREVLNKMG